MKIMFVCKGNAGRSPMAETLFNNLSKKSKAFSAGVKVAHEGAEGHNVSQHNSVLLKEIGYDMSELRRKQLTKKMVAEADVVISFLRSNKLPSYLKNSKKLKYWIILDPHGKPYKVRRKIRDTIKKRVEILVKQIG